MPAVILSILALMMVIFTMPVWLWKLFIFRRIRECVNCVEHHDIKVEYRGSIGHFHLHLPNRQVIGFYGCKALRDKIRSGVNNLIRIVIGLLIFQVLAGGAYLLLSHEGGVSNLSIHPVWLIPWSEIISVILFIVFIVDAWSEFERLEDDLPDVRYPPSRSRKGRS